MAETERALAVHYPHIVVSPGRSRGFVASVVAVSVAVALVVLGVGLWESDVLTQRLWSRTLAIQAACVLAFAGLATVVGVWAVPSPRLRGWPTLAGIAVFGCAAAAGIGATLAAGAIVGCCYVAGHGIFIAAGERGRCDPMLCVTTGLGAVMLVLVGVGILQLPMLPVFWLMLAGAMGSVALSPRLRTALLAPAPEGPVIRWSVPRATVAWLILACILFYGANAALPERLWDALAMHLLIPTQVLTYGRWLYDPGQFTFAFFPLGADYVFAFAMVLGGEAAVKAINLLALGGILLLLHDIVRSFAPTWVTEIVLLLLLSLPVALLATASAMVENLLCLLVLAANRAVLTLTARSPRTSLLAMAVILPAMAAVKLHGAVAAVGLGILAISLARFRWLGRRDWIVLCITAGVSGSLGAAQYAFAWYRTGNPLFPMMNDTFRSPFWPAEPFEDTRWQGHLSWDLLYQMTFHSAGFMECLNGALGFAFLVLLLPGVVATLLLPRRAPVVALLAAGFYLAVVLGQVQYIRYLYPVLPLLLIICAHGVAVLADYPWGRRLGAMAAGVAALLGLLVLPSGAWVLGAADLRAAYDETVRHALLLNQVPTRLAVVAVNALSARDPRVLFGGEPYGTSLRGLPIYTNWYNYPLNSALSSAPNSAAATMVLDAQNADFLIVPPLSADPIDRKLLDYAQLRGTRIPLPGSTGLWRITIPR